MIGKLKGRIDTIDEDSVILDVGGVGYHIFCTGRTLGAMGAKGDALELIIHTHVREDHIHLFGFSGAPEREWFRLLMTVQGVGVKMAMAVLSVFAPQELAYAIAAKDVKSLTRVSGVGPKLAERIAVELKTKAVKLPTGSVVVPIKGGKGPALPAATPSEDAISALVNLGYSRSDAYNAVGLATGKLGENSEIDALIKESLRALARA